MSHELIFLFVVIGLAFAFEFINGFHDAANSVAAIVATGVLKPFQAVLWAAIFNFLAFFIFKLHVADTMGKGLIDAHVINTYFIMSTLLGAIIFNLITWYFGLPSSSSHALIGGLVGSALIAGGTGALKILGLVKVLAFVLISPLLGFAIAWILMSFFLKVLKNPESTGTNKISKVFQLIAAAMLSLGHGGNDAQKTMGIIAILLFSAGMTGATFAVPDWVVFSCYSVMALGTLAGGWRIIHTMGKKITPLNCLGGGCSSMGAATTLFIANYFGIPMSTTHTVTGSITGVGSARGGKGTNWHVMKKIVWAWLFTIPSAALFAAFFMSLHPVFTYFFGNI
jgi:PiT family inorganic phosphate transporter